LSCGACREGKRCQSDTDCWSRTCVAGECAEKTCRDGIKNGEESAVDCGGSCEPCDINEPCESDEDCKSGNCPNPSGTGEPKCAKANCQDGTQNGDETDVDCGGSRCGRCEMPGQGCEDDEDCAEEMFCNTSISGGPKCQVEQCGNGVSNTGETGIDCGGVCPPCPSGDACESDGDCQSKVCDEGTCQAPSCEDDKRNGEESDVDCGRNCDPRCRMGKTCRGDEDCQSGACGENGTCVAPTCEDGVPNGEETDTDCGGPNRPGCELTQTCEMYVR
ncbi:MAG: hypothetical protein ABEN55_00745, partial [Bradymonadaceae bacterium]